MQNRSKFDRRTMGYTARHLSILERRATCSRRRCERIKRERRFNNIGYAVSLFGFVVSYLLWVSEIFKNG